MVNKGIEIGISIFSTVYATYVNSIFVEQHRLSSFGPSAEAAVIEKHVLVEARKYWQYAAVSCSATQFFQRWETKPELSDLTARGMETESWWDGRWGLAPGLPSGDALKADGCGTWPGCGADSSSRYCGRQDLLEVVVRLPLGWGLGLRLVLGLELGFVLGRVICLGLGLVLELRFALGLQLV